MGVKHLADNQSSKIKVVGLVMTSQEFSFARIQGLFHHNFGALCVQIVRIADILINGYLEECQSGGVFLSASMEAVINESVSSKNERWASLIRQAVYRDCLE